MPSSPATSREAFSRAEATPDRSGGMPPRIASVSGAFIRPAPAPKTTNPGSSAAKLACWPSRGNRTRPPAISTRPPAHQHNAAGDRAVGPHPGHDRGGQDGEDHHGQGHGDEGQPGLGRGEAEHVLQVQRGEEVDPEYPEAPKH